MRTSEFLFTFMAFGVNAARAQTSCEMPSFSGSSFSIVDSTPYWINVKVTISPTAKSTEGWSALVIFTSSIENDISVQSNSAVLSAESSNRKALTFSNQEFNKDISQLQQFSFTFSMERATGLPNHLYSMALVGFYETPVSDGSCFLEPNLIEPDLTSTTTISSPTSTMHMTSSTTSATSPILPSTMSSTTENTALTGSMTSTSGENLCPGMPLMYGTSYSVIEQGENFTAVVVSLEPTQKSSDGWSTVIIFTDPLPSDVIIDSFSVDVSAISEDRRVLTLTNKIHNVDLSAWTQYSFALYLVSNGLPSMSMTALVGYFEEKISDGSCVFTPNPVSPISTTSATATSTTTSATSTSTTLTILASTTSSATVATVLTSATPSTIASSDCQDVDFTIENSGWNNAGNWNFIFRIRASVSNYDSWTVKIVFSKAVSSITSNHVELDGPHAGGRVWLLKAKSWNSILSNQELTWTEIAVTTGSSPPTGNAILCNNGVVPDVNLLSSM